MGSGYFIFLIVLVFLIFSQNGESAAPGSTSLPFLKIGIGARMVGMGEAASATVKDVTASYWNPSRLVLFRGQNLSLMHNEWFQGTRYEYMGYGISSGGSALCISFGGLYTADIELRESATEFPKETFSAYNFILSFSYAKTIGDKFSLGFTAKKLYERIYIYSASGWGYDLGFSYRGPFQSIEFGGAVSNLGARFRLRNEGYKLPTQFRLGFSWTPPWRIKNGDGLVALDIVDAIDGKLKSHVGLEYVYRKRIATRIGWKLGYDTESFTAGLGYKFKRYTFDYAFVPNRLGTTHRISLGVNL